MSVGLKGLRKKMAGWNCVPLSRSEMVRLRVRARRRGVWFKVLSRVERGLMELAIEVVERVRSLVLARSLLGVVEKLLDAMESMVARLVKTVGCSLARKLSEIALGWGNESARLWADDPGFMRYLAVIQKNLSPVFEV